MRNAGPGVSAEAALKEPAEATAMVLNRRSSPPLALEPVLGAAGFVESVERSEILAGQHEVKDLGVLRDPLAVRRLRDDDEIPLHAPSQKHLGRCAPHAFSDLPHALIREMPTGAERA